MCREKSFLSFLQTMVVVLLLHHHHHHQACDATSNSDNQKLCPPSSCGKMRNIKHPFRLKNDPTNCGDPRYELSCENNITTLSLFWGKYYVKSINYKNYTIRVVDPGIEEGDCTIPRYFLTATNFTSYYSHYEYKGDPYAFHDYSRPEHVVYLNCSKQLKNDPMYVDTSTCRLNSENNSYIYAIAGDFRVVKLNVGCRVKLVTMSSALAFISKKDFQPFSYVEIHRFLSYGFELSWIRQPCEDSCDMNQQNCYMNYDSGGLVCTVDYCTTPLGIDISCGK
ncbi:putative wall-associated receptor kinase, galacturonan-binding domain-containing protein [Medicago truncatula]|nr:putative wall-associated receptor kinase, galacturonan-binding domain-containing protein [Medicago truncatula]